MLPVTTSLPKGMNDEMNVLEALEKDAKDSEKLFMVYKEGRVLLGDEHQFFYHWNVVFTIARGCSFKNNVRGKMI